MSHGASPACVGIMSDEKVMLWGSYFPLLVCIMHLAVTDALPPHGVAVKPCGEIKCHLFEFCASQHSLHCRQCSEVCAETGAPGVDDEACSEHCQEYIYEMKFKEWFQTVTSEMSSQWTMSMVAVIFATVALLLTALFLLIHLNTRVKSLIFGLALNKKASSTAAVINAGKNKAACPATNSNLRLMVPKPGEQTTLTDLPSAGATTTTTFGTVSVPSTPYYGKNGAITPATMSTPLSTRPPRHPSEDATLEHAYDNHGLSRSSENVLDESVSPHVTRAKESSF